MTTTEQQTGTPLSSFARHGGPGLGLALVAPLAGGALLVWQAWTLASLLGDAIENGASPDSLAPAVGLILILLLLRAALGAIGERAGTAGAEAIKTELRARLFAKVLARPPRSPRHGPAGATAAAIVDQVEALDGFFAHYLPALIQASVLPIAFGAIVLPLDWLAGLLFLITAPLIPLFMALAGWGAQIATKRQARALSLLSGRFADRLRGMMTLKLFGRAEAETAGIVAASDALRRRSLRVLRIAFLSSAVLEFFAALGVAGVALYVGLTFIDYLQLRSTPLTLQLGLFLLLMAPEIYNPLRLLAAHYHDREAARAAIAEIEAQLGTIPPALVALADTPCAAAAGPVGVRLANLTLRTPDTAHITLAGADLIIAPGTHMALLGPSGVGKSTMLEAIAGLRRREGHIRLDGRELADWPESELRSRVAMLGQNPRIFAGSIADNIALARPGASAADIRHAAELALVLPFAAALPEGLDTMIGEGGFGLSGGQAHRIALARIYLRPAGLILLDEPTAHLDAALEQRVLDGLEHYARGRTLVIATHSLAVAKRMDTAWRLAGADLHPLPALAGEARS